MDRPEDRGRVTRSCVDRKFCEIEGNLGRARRPTAKQRRLAAEVACAHPEQASSLAGAVGLVLLTAVLLVLVLLTR